jgi:hypothetical protein
MNDRHRRARAAAALAALVLCLAAPLRARAQDSAPPPTPDPLRAHTAAQTRGEINHEVQLYLLASTGEAARGRVPDSLEGVVRQLRATLPPASYRTALTLVNRVRDGSNLEFRGVSAPLLSPATAAPAAPNTQTTFTYSLGRVRLTEDAAGGRFIHLSSLRFVMRVFAQVGTSVVPEDAMLSTEVSVREGEPTVVGTLTTGRPDEFFVLVINIRRAGQR